MSTALPRPTTLTGIRRLANRKKKAHGIKHAQALDIAANDAGFENYRHARNVLEATSGPSTSKPYTLYITAYWKHRDTGESGRETFRMHLAVPWNDLIRPNQLYHRNFHRFIPVGSDHFECSLTHQYQVQARKAVCEVARAFQFMESTGLRPSSGHSRGRVEGRFGERMPGVDHSSLWFDPKTRRYLMVDEPYEPAVNGKAHKREAWAAEHGYEMAKPDWAGMYTPLGGSRLYLISQLGKGVPLAPIVEALNRQDKAIVEDPWNGESEPFSPRFVSPGTHSQE